MNIEQLEHESLQMSRGKFLGLVNEMLGGARGGREDDDHPLPVGPWDSVIREALEKTFRFGPQPDPWRVFGPVPEPWRPAGFRTNARWEGILASILARHPELYDVIGGGHNPLEEVALNPQPLPPLYAFLVSVAQTVIARAELLQEIAGATLHEGEPQRIIIVGGYISRFCDDVCGSGFRWKWPRPGPHPHWFDHELRGIDLLVLAAQFEQGAREAYSPALRRNLSDASARLAEAGLSRMQ